MDHREEVANRPLARENTVIKPPPTVGEPAVTRTVILVHGLWMTGLELLWLAWGLRCAGFRVRTFHYPSVRLDLAENGRRLARYQEKILARGDEPTGKTHLVAHSLGGLVCAQMLRDQPAQAAYTERFVALGVPFLGSASAKKLATFPLGTRIIGHAFPRTKGATNFPEILPCERWTHPIELGSIAGNYPLGVGRLVRAFTTPNDGVVAVAETRLPGATAYLTLPINHVAMTFSRRVMAETCHFLRHGAFEEGGR